jgi:uncharacterized protein GlcG (DUF336 family)
VRVTKTLAIVGASLAVLVLAASSQAGEEGPKPPPVKPAQGLVMSHDLSLEMAKAAAQATLDHCRQGGYHTVAVVVDRAGEVLVMLRDEQATLTMMEMARRKAYTARMFRRSTKEWGERTKPGTDINAQRDLPGVLALSGGVPIKVGEETIGAVGSAGSSLELDDACAKAGVAKAESLMK